VDVDERDALERERDFLLRSLDDLDVEREAGNIDPETYERLHADYTARAAVVLRNLRDGLDVQAPAAPPVSRGRVWLWAGVVVAFAAVVTALLVQSVGDREPGGSLTGNDPVASAPSTVERGRALAQAATDDPDSYPARIAYARYLLNRDLQQAVVEYDAAARLAPRQPEPLAYGGWIRVLVATQLDAGADRDLLLSAALERFQRAIDVRDDYADSFAFRGLTKAQVLDDPDGAVPDLQRFLQLTPLEHPQRDTVLDALADACERSDRADCDPTPSTTTP
jgi:tetratricopeptide (TPR) repeat protein